MVRRDISALIGSLDNLVLVKSQFEGLANIDVVEWLCQVIHGVPVDRQLWYPAKVRARFGLWKIGRGYRSPINLPHLISLVGRVLHFVERKDDLHPGNGSIVVGIGHNDQLLIVRILFHLERTRAAPLDQIVGPACAILGNQALLDHERGGID